MENGTTNTSSIQRILTGLPIATASLYVLGVCFYQGFARVLGLEETQFSLSVDRTLFHGFFAILNVSAPQLGYFLLAAETIALVSFVVVGVCTSSKVRNAIESFFSKMSQKKQHDELQEVPPQITDFAQFASNMVFFSGVVLLVIFGILGAGVLADLSGQEAANSFLRRAVAGKSAFVEVFVVGEEKPLKGHTILCSSSHCAYLVDKKAVTYRHEQIEKTVVRGIEAGKRDSPAD
jgi:hypothetical protein